MNLEFDEGRIEELTEAEALAVWEDARALIKQADRLRSIAWNRVQELRSRKRTDEEREHNRKKRKERKIADMESEYARTGNPFVLASLELERLWQDLKQGETPVVNPVIVQTGHRKAQKGEGGTAY